MEKVSVWKESTTQSHFPQLTGDTDADVAIVGGGITGITAAYLLSKAGKRVVVLEAREISDGSTGFSTGNLYATVGNKGMHSIKQKWDEDTLHNVIESRGSAVDFIEQIVQQFNIDCDFKRVPWCLFAEEGGDTDYVEKEREVAEKAGLTVVDGVPFPLHIKTGFTVPNQAQFNPYQYTSSFARHIQSENCIIYENTKVTNVKEGDTCTVETTGGTVTADYVIMATHTPKGVYLVHTSLEPYREYAVAVTLNGDYPEPGIFWDVQTTQHYSMRVYDSPKGKVLMVLGESHKVGMKEESEECYNNLESFLRRNFDVASVAYKWSAQQYKPADGLPHIGISTGNNKTYIATGFSADGLTFGTLAAMIISDEILGIENPWKKTYKAARLTPVASFTQFVKENASVGFELVKDWLTKREADSFREVSPRDGKVMQVDGKRCAVHRDDTGNLHVVSAVCTHMGCIVHWNQGEQSWDCPCHGSRFTPDGEVIEGPAINALKKVGISDDDDSSGANS
jgi:glycine/D-amino acid oxidase-like deaminating enzyme/nitrite reductase/ring-hydroxylating ferredoxin subunit